MLENPGEYTPLPLIENEGALSVLSVFVELHSGHLTTRPSSGFNTNFSKIAPQSLHL